MKRTNSISGSASGVKRAPGGLKSAQAQDSGLWPASGLRLLLSLSACFLFSSNISAGENNPKEVNAIVGTSITPLSHKYSNDADNLLGYHSFGGEDLSRSAKLPHFGIDYGYIEKYPVFLITERLRNGAYNVFDAQALTEIGLAWHKKNGEIAGRRGFNISIDCKQTNSSRNPGRHGYWLIGLVKPRKNKEGCTHYSKDISSAWEINQTTGKISRFSGKSSSIECLHTSITDCD